MAVSSDRVSRCPCEVHAWRFMNRSCLPNAVRCCWTYLCADVWVWSIGVVCTDVKVLCTDVEVCTDVWLICTGVEVCTDVVRVCTDVWVCSTDVRVGYALTLRYALTCLSMGSALLTLDGDAGPYGLSGTGTGCLHSTSSRIDRRWTDVWFAARASRACAACVACCGDGRTVWYC